MYKGKARFVTQAAVIAALYVVLTYIANMFGMANGIVQVRISEALTILPYFTPAAIPGLFVGCLLANMLTNTTLVVYDVVFGSVATLISAFASYALRKYKFFVPIPPIIINSLTVPIIYNIILRLDDHTFWSSVALVGAGELISCGVLGIALMLALEDYRDKLFPDDSPIVIMDSANAEQNQESNIANSDKETDWKEL